MIKTMNNLYHKKNSNRTDEHLYAHSSKESHKECENSNEGMQAII